LYSVTGSTLLATQSWDPATQGTSSGWQDVYLASPINLTGGSSYHLQFRDPIETGDGYNLATYYASSGGTMTLDRGTAIGGYYAYSTATSAFAGSSFTEFYWTDALFLPTGTDPTTFRYYPRLETLATKANRGFVFRVSSTVDTNFREAVVAWYPNNDIVYDSPVDLNTGVDPWTTFIVDPTQLTQTGTLNIAAVTSVEFRVTAKDINRFRFYINKICTATNLTLVGGTAPDTAGSFKDFVNYGTSSGVRTWLGYANSGQYFFVLPLQIGNGSTATRFRSTAEAVAWAAPQANTANPWRYAYGDSKMGLVINASASDDIVIDRTPFSMKTGKILFQTTGSSSATVQFKNIVFPAVGTNTFSIGSFTDCTFTSSDRLVLNGATFSSCTIQSSTDATGALYWQSTSSTINGCVFTGNTVAIAVVLSGNRTINLSALTFSGNTNDWIVTGTGTLTIVRDAATTTDKSWASIAGGVTSGGINASGLTGNVVVQAPVTTYVRAVTNVPTGSSVLLAVRSANGFANLSQFTLAAGNNSGNGTLVISGSIPADTPASGFVRVARNTGAEDRLAFTSRTGSTFTLSGTLPATYSAGNGCYVGYLDVINNGSTTITASLQYVSDRNVVLTIRQGSGSGKFQDYQSNYTLTNADSIIPFSAIADPVNNL
jgi:hypothetical protein